MKSLSRLQQAIVAGMVVVAMVAIFRLVTINSVNERHAQSIEDLRARLESGLKEVTMLRGKLSERSTREPQPTGAKLQGFGGVAMEGDDAMGRAAWERHWGEPYPGRKFGADPRCSFERRPPPLPEWGSHRTWDRNNWIEGTVSELRKQRKMNEVLKVLEIGACSAPADFQRTGPNVHVTYLDWTDDEDILKEQCTYLKDEASTFIRPDIVDDASVLGTIKNNRFDLVFTSHVLEHVSDVVGALHNWLRVLKPGGFAVAAVPSMCDALYGIGERFKLAATAEHFIEEFKDHGQALRNYELGHFRECAVSKASIPIILRQLGLLTGYSGLFLPLPDTAYGKVLKLTADDDEVSPENLDRWEKQCIAEPHSMHVHSWTGSSMQAMLRAAIPVLAEAGTPFKIVSCNVAGRTTFNMQEVRFVIQRL